jgi:hypothetical protein
MRTDEKRFARNPGGTPFVRVLARGVFARAVISGHHRRAGELSADQGHERGADADGCRGTRSLRRNIGKSKPQPSRNPNTPEKTGK